MVLLGESSRRLPNALLRLALSFLTWLLTASVACTTCAHMHRGRVGQWRAARRTKRQTARAPRPRTRSFSITDFVVCLMPEPAFTKACA